VRTLTYVLGAVAGSSASQRSRHLIQKRLEDFYNEDELFGEQEWAEPSFRLMLKN